MKEQSTNRNESKTILVVEDSPVQAFAMIQLLEQRGLNVLCAPDGLAGVALAKKSHPDLIILDIHMPEMDGMEACHIIKQDQDFEEVPIIFLTAHSGPETLRQGFDEGAVDFIPKDAFSDIVLLKTLEELKILSDGETGEVK